MGIFFCDCNLSSVKLYKRVATSWKKIINRNDQILKMLVLHIYYPSKI